MKIWQKDIQALAQVEKFTVGQDKTWDLLLAPYDVLGSLAHINMLCEVGLLPKEDLATLSAALKEIYQSILANNFSLDENAEDIHSQIEFLLTQKLGDAGKKIHSARSRNDQVLLDLKLFMRAEIEKLVQSVETLFNLLIEKSNQHKNDLLPGYTHLQLAMPSSFGLWFGAYAESLSDDLIPLQAAFKIVNKNPLGSAAGYGSSFPIKRQTTTDLLGFDEMNYNVVYAQMGRGKTERIVAASLSNFAATLSKLSMDAILFLNQHFAFISFPEELTTGSSIMPHKKNPDVFEIIRAHCNRLVSLPNEINLLSANLTSGYHRDFQLMKEHFIPAFNNLQDCLQMATLMLSNISVQENILADAKYANLFSVEEVNKLVLQGMPFRDAYKLVGKNIAEGNFNPETEPIHVHEGSMGYLCNDKITAAFNKNVTAFEFDKIAAATKKLLAS